MIELRSGEARCVVCPEDGGRIAALEIDSTRVIVETPSEQSDLSPMLWGCFPMTPWAGRVRRGSFTFEDVERHLPINMAPHSIHGVGFTSAWTVVASDET